MSYYSPSQDLTIWKLPFTWPKSNHQIGPNQNSDNLQKKVQSTCYKKRKLKRVIVSKWPLKSYTYSCQAFSSTFTYDNNEDDANQEEKKCLLISITNRRLSHCTRRIIMRFVEYVFLCGSSIYLPFAVLLVNVYRLLIILGCAGCLLTASGDNCSRTIQMEAERKIAPLHILIHA